MSEIIKSISSSQLAEIREFIATNLLKRGINAPLSPLELSEDCKLSITSTKFQTVPVLFKSLEVYSINSVVCKHEKSDYKFVISICARLEHFTGVYDSVHLFDLFGSFGENGRVYGFKTI